MSNNEDRDQHYASENLTERLRTVFDEIGFNDAPIPLEKLAPLDQFHSRGLAATKELAGVLGIAREDRVLDIGSGSGLVAIAAAKVGAASVLAADIDAFSTAAIALNAAANGVTVSVTQDDLIGVEGDWDVILVGDLFYERPLAERLLAWLKTLNRPALLGDPGRSYFPKDGRLKNLARYEVATTRELEDLEVKKTGVWTFP